MAAQPELGRPSLFVGGLPQVTEDDVRALLAPYGAVHTVALKRGYAFATFLEEGAAEAACELDGGLFGNKTLAVRIQAPENMRRRVPLAALPTLPVVAAPAVLSSAPSLFIGALAPGVGEDDLRALLAAYGTVNTVTLKRGYAFATFLEPEALEAACTLNGMEFAGRPLAVRIQTPENMKPRRAPARVPAAAIVPAIAPAPLPTREPSLFVGALPKGTSEDDVAALLSQCGTVASVTLKKGYAFATFVEPGALEAACALDGMDFGGKALAVRIQSPENMRPRNGIGAATAAPAAVPVGTLFLGGLPATVTEHDVRVLAQPYGAIHSIALHRGYAFVNYGRLGAAELAATYLDNMAWGGKRISARPQPAPQATVPVARPRATPTAAPLFVKTHPSLFVGGLQRHITERELRLLLAPYGTILKLTLFKEKGYCFVDYEAPGCAEKAAELLNGFVLDGKPLGVRVQAGANRMAAKEKPRFAPY
nr:T-cell-restricted intracellular antigen-1 [Euglena gracilis]